MSQGFAGGPGGAARPTPDGGPAPEADSFLRDTIVARATGSGPAGVALLRISGSRADAILQGLTGGKGLPPARRATLMRLLDPGSGELLDRGLVTRFPEPASFTGEGVVEIGCHGGRMAPALVLDACLELGAREAEPGEFTRRAYLNGKLDLVQVEALQDLIESGSRAGYRAALHQMEGGLSRRLGELREGLLQLQVLLAHHVDFPDEDDPPTPLERIRSEAAGLGERLEELLRLAPEGELLREGALVVLAGPPNAGKSSLFNALLGEERAIVTDQPGTTRDAVEAGFTIGGFPFRLVDTAGVRETSERVEQLGVEVARRYLDAAQVVLYCHPVDRPWGEPERDFLQGLGDRQVLVLRSCADRVRGGGGAGEIRVSVRTGEGLAELRERLRREVYQGLDREGPPPPLITRERQRRRVAAAREEMRGFGEALERGIPVDVAAAHLEEARVELEELLGAVDPEEVLDRLFATFCIGK